jgi:hypothetical protein
MGQHEFETRDRSVWWLWVGIFALVALLIYVAMSAFRTSSGAPAAKADQGIQVDANGWQEPTPAPEKARKSKPPVPAPTVTLQGYQKTTPRPTATKTITVPTDPRFRTCGLANLAGYGNYRTGDPEYGWYIDRDHDGIACEFTIKTVPAKPAPTASRSIKPSSKPTNPTPTKTIIIPGPTVTITLTPTPKPTSPAPTETEDPEPATSKVITPEPTESDTPITSPSASG